MAPPAWAPTVERVANYVPRRTIVGAADGYGNAAGTFSPDTHPTAAQVTQLIADACEWVTLATGAVHDSLTDSATTVAAIRAAATVEIGYPDNRDDLTNGQALYDQAVAMRTDLARRNEVLTGEGVDDPAAHLMPVWSFPAAPAWGDETFL